MEKVKELLKKEKFLILIITLVCSIMFFYKMGSYKLIDVDEPRYAEAAREMLRSGDWITPYFNFDLRFDKPVLIYWLIAFSYVIFGICEFAARFPSAILASALVFFTYYLGRTVDSKRFGFISALILASSLEFIAISRMSMTDMTLSFFICATLISGFLGSFVEENNRKYWWWFAYFFSALAVLTKGPIGFILPAGVLGLYFLLTGSLKENLKLKYLLPGSLIFAVTSVPWYYLIIKKHGMDFINYFFLQHNFARFSSNNFGQHSQPVYFYIIVLFAGFFPWTLYLIPALIQSFKNISKALKEKKQLCLAPFKNTENKLKVILFLLLWFLVIFTFFSLSRAKLLTYILPIFPALALLTGMLWNDYIENNKNHKSIQVGTGIFCVLCLVIAIVLKFGINLILPRDAKVLTGDIGILPVIFFTLIPVLILSFLKKRIISFALIIVFMAGTTYIAVNKILPIIYNSGPGDLVSYSEYYKKATDKDKSLLAYGLLKPSIVFYSQSKVEFIEDPGILKKSLDGKKCVFVILKNDRLSEISGFVRYSLIKTGIKYSLITNKKT